MIATLELTPLTKLTKDLKSASKLLSKDEARFLVDGYYLIQERRIAAAAQVRALTASEEPHEVLDWMFAQMEQLEHQVRRALDAWTDTQPTGVWLKGICGIGPVLAAGLLAHIDITKAPTAGHIWAFAGLDPTKTWNKGEKRPWNADLKVLAYKCGESFVKVQNNPKDVYGKLFAERREKEDRINEAGGFREQAAKALEQKRYRKETAAYEAYSEGKLPKAHLHARARRYCVKIFLSHLQAEMYFQHYGKEPPAPFPIAILGHAHMIERP